MAFRVLCRAFAHLSRKVSQKDIGENTDDTTNSVFLLFAAGLLQRTKK